MMPWKPEYAARRKAKAAADPEYRARRNAQGNGPDKEKRAEYNRAWQEKNAEHVSAYREARKPARNAHRKARYNSDADYRSAEIKKSVAAKKSKRINEQYEYVLSHTGNLNLDLKGIGNESL